MAKGQPEGRPPSITTVVRHDEQPGPDGFPILVPITIGQQVVERIRTGLDLNDAAASSNITRTTIWNWRRKGSLYRAQRAAGRQVRNRDADAYVGFVNALERAEADAELIRLEIILGAARGGFVTTRTVTTTDAEGKVTSTTTTTETLAPQWVAAAWYLERRGRGKYVRPTALTPVPMYVDTGVVDDEQHAAEVLDDLEQFLADTAATPD